MVTVSWCKKQKKGLKLIPANENLFKTYLLEAESTLNSLRDIKLETNSWKAAKKYYFEYFLIYSFLIKCGIKCEIHDCTIKVCEILENENFLPRGVADMLEKDKQLRIDNQYYLKNKKVKIDFEELATFYLEIKDLINSLTLEEINKIRGLIK